MIVKLTKLEFFKIKSLLIVELNQLKERLNSTSRPLDIGFCINYITQLLKKFERFEK